MLGRKSALILFSPFFLRPTPQIQEQET